MENLPQPAKRLIAWVSALASIVLVSALLQWHGSDPLRVAEWFLLAALAGTARVRFPGLDSCYSLGYIVVLAAMTMLPFSEVILVSLVTSLAQCCWRPARRPQAIQVLFNIFDYAISAAAAWGAFHALAYLAPAISLVARFTFGAALFFLLNTGLVSWVLAILVESRFIDVWENSHLLVFPFYVVGAGCAALIGSQNTLNPWLFLSILPVMYLAFLSMRGWVRKTACGTFERHIR